MTKRPHNQAKQQMTFREDAGFDDSRFNMTLSQDGKELGNFWFDDKAALFRFKGDVDRSAKIFVDCITNYLKEWCEKHYKQQRATNETET